MVGRMHEPSPPGRTPLSIGFAWAYRVTAVGLEFVLPALAGYWIDGRLGSRPVGMLLGAVLGFAVQARGGGGRKQAAAT